MTTAGFNTTNVSDKKGTTTSASPPVSKFPHVARSRINSLSHSLDTPSPSSSDLNFQLNFEQHHGRCINGVKGYFE